MNVGIIPARMASSRFPGKPLIDILGMPMIEHVWRRSKKCQLLSEVYIATCDRQIFDAAKSFGAEVIMTKDTHQMCMDRVVEAVSKIETDITDIVVTIQGDEPLIKPQMITRAVEVLSSDPALSATTLCQEITDPCEINDPNRVKIVWNKNKEVLYISRESIPSIQKAKKIVKYYKMVCVYAMSCRFLMNYGQMPISYLEEIESIDMLRIIENGYRLGIGVISGKLVNIDVPEDHQYVVEMMKDEDIFLSYKGG